MSQLTPSEVKGQEQFEAADPWRVHDDVADSKVGGLYNHKEVEFSATEAHEWSSWMMYVASVLGSGTLSMAIRNETGGALAAGTLLYTSSWNAAESRFLVGKADASDPIKPAMLVLDASLADETNGTAYPIKHVTDLDTSGAAAVGDPVYLSAATPGEFVYAAPSGATYLVHKVGVVTVKHATTGEVRFFLSWSLLEKFSTSSYQDDSVTNAKIGPLAVDTPELAAAAITPVELDDAIADALPKMTLAVAAEDSNNIDVTIQLKDIQDNNLAEARLIKAWLSDTATGGETATAPDTDFSVQTGTLLKEVTINKHLEVLASASGVAVLRVSDTGSPTFYLRAAIDGGKVYTSDAITFAI